MIEQTERERILAVELNASSHEKTCAERYTRIDASMSEIKTSLADMTRTFRESVQRVHTRHDEDKDANRAALTDMNAKVDDAVTQLTQKNSGLELQIMRWAVAAAVPVVVYLLIYGAPWTHKAAGG